MYGSPCGKAFVRRASMSRTVCICPLFCRPLASHDCNNIQSTNSSSQQETTPNKSPNVQTLVLHRWCSGLNTVGIFLTFLFVPEPLRVPLAELDRRYAYSAAGKVYHGALLLAQLAGSGLDIGIATRVKSQLLSSFAG